MNWLTRAKDWVKGSGGNLRRFLGEVRSEMEKVSFPSKQEVVGTTIVVLVTSAIFAVYLAIVDLAISGAYKKVLAVFGS